MVNYNLINRAIKLAISYYEANNYVCADLERGGKVFYRYCNTLSVSRCYQSQHEKKASLAAERNKILKKSSQKRH